VLEPACHEAEALLLGYNTPSKTMILCLYMVVPLADLIAKGAWTWQEFVTVAPLIALHWYWFTVAVVVWRVVYLIGRHDFRIAMIWFVKLVTDPFTDLISYRPWRAERIAS